MTLHRYIAVRSGGGEYTVKFPVDNSYAVLNGDRVIYVILVVP